MRPASTLATLHRFRHPRLYANGGRRIRVLAKPDPLARVYVGGFTLDDFSFDATAGLRQKCGLRNLNERA